MLYYDLRFFSFPSFAMARSRRQYTHDGASRQFRFLFSAFCLLLCVSPAPAQNETPTLRLDGIYPAGVRMFATDAWGSFDFSVTNLTDRDRSARVLVSFLGNPDVQYGRDVWVPARSRVSTWMLVGPAVLTNMTKSCDMEVVLSDRTDGQDRVVLPPGEERLRMRGMFYRKREPFTAVMLDEEVPGEVIPGRLPQPDSRDEESLLLARTFRLACKPALSEYVTDVTHNSLPRTVEALDGVEHFVLASDRIAKDPAGMRALRDWVMRGGRLWVMLDRVDAQVLGPLLGDALDFQVVDRVTLTKFDLETRASGNWAPEPISQQHERPVEFTRVLLPAEEQAANSVNGWPVWFTRPLGRGKVIFTTLGPRGWYQPRKSSDPHSPFPSYPDMPVPATPLEVVAEELQPARDESPFLMESFHPLLAEEIGFAVVSRATVLFIFGGALLAALVVGLALRKSRRPEVLGWLGPAAALGAAAIFFAVGESSRRAVAPTVAVAQVVDAVSGTEGAPVRGLLAVYRPESGPVEYGAGQGGLFDLDMAGTEGQTRRLILTDMDKWHWENLAFPAGERLATFQYTVPTKEPMTAVAHFGPDGLEGRLAAGPFQDLGDALLHTPSGRNLAVRLGPGGTFSAGIDDILPTGQFLASAVLSDRQQRRQELCREFLKRPATGRTEAPNVLVVWAKPVDMHFSLAPEAQEVGNALLVVPLKMERPGPGQVVTIPGPLIPCRRMIDKMATRVTAESEQPVDMQLRFQLPPQVLPLKLERARIVAKITAPSRRVTISGRADAGFVEFHHQDSPLDPIRVGIPKEFLHLDKDGGLYVNVAISEPSKGAAQTEVRGGEKWMIEYLEVEVSGRAE